MSNETYQAGVARADITPASPLFLCGYTVREGESQGVDEALTATALVLGAGDNTIALIAVDLTLATVAMVDEWRERCGRALGIPASHILINFNHTHSAPILPGWSSGAPPEQLKIQNDYAEYVASQLERACRDASAKLQPARLKTGWGECKGNINRRQKTEDGAVLLGEDPQGPCDSSVGVIRVDDLAGNPLAVAFRYSCHTVTLGPRTNLVSPDYAGPARALVERELGCLSLFLQGCAGNINPISGIGQDAEGREDTERLGQMLGSEVLKVCTTLRSHRRRSEPKLIQSVAVYWLYEYETIAPNGEGSIRVQQTEMELPLVPFPPIEEVQAERSEWAARLAEARRDNARESAMNVFLRFDHWSQMRLDTARESASPVTVKFPVQTIDIGDISIVALPFETMTETGLALRAALAKTATFVLGYSNGVITYLPTPEVSREGGMEARLGYKNYMLPAEIPGDWEPLVKERALSMLAT